MGFFKIVVLTFIFIICVSMFIYFIRDIFKDYVIARHKEKMKIKKKFKAIKGGKILNDQRAYNNSKLRIYK